MKSNQKGKNKKRVKKVQRVAAQKGVFPSGYSRFLFNIKKQIKLAQVKAALAVNKEMVLLYWDIGRKIYEKQKEELLSYLTQKDSYEKFKEFLMGSNNKIGSINNIRIAIIKNY